MKRNLLAVAIGLVVAGGVHTAALACESQYDAAARVARIPCVSIVGGTQSFGVVLEWTGGNNFVLTSSEEYALVNPTVSSLRILATVSGILAAPPFVAIIYGYYSGGCVSAYGRPSVVQTGNNIDIRLKARVLTRTDVACTAALVPFAEIVSLLASSPTYTYSVNGVSITPTF